MIPAWTEATEVLWQDVFTALHRQNKTILLGTAMRVDGTTMFRNMIVARGTETPWRLVQDVFRFSVALLSNPRRSDPDCSGQCPFKRRSRHEAVSSSKLFFLAALGGGLCLYLI